MKKRQQKAAKKQEQKECAIVGIDFGTTSTKAARVDATGTPEVVRYNGKDLQEPTEIFFHDDGRVEFGHRARNYALASPHNSYSQIKRLLGQVGPDGQPPPLGSNPKTRDSMSAVALTALFLRHVKECIEEELQAPIAGAVVTVPAYYQDLQRRHTKEAAERAGIAVLRLVHEPVAAALSYLVEREEEGLFLVFDLGGGTFDATIVERRGDDVAVKAIDGDFKLGGCDFDMIMKNAILAELERQTGRKPDPVDDARDLQELDNKVTQARHDLSQSESVTIIGHIGTCTYQYELSRNDFNKMVQDIVDRTVELCRRCLVKANVEAKELDGILLVGGATHMPCIQESLEGAFGKIVRAARDREFCVAKGAAISAVLEARQGTDMELAGAAAELPVPNIEVKAKTAHPLSIAIVDRNDPQKRRQVHHVMIPAQSDVPCSKTELFTPVEDNVPFVQIQVTQGIEEAPVNAGDVTYSVDLSITPLPKAERHQSIEVTYRFDADSIIQVHAKDLKSGNEADGQVGMPSALHKH